MEQTGGVFGQFKRGLAAMVSKKNFLHNALRDALKRANQNLINITELLEDDLSVLARESSKVSIRGPSRDTIRGIINKLEGKLSEIFDGLYEAFKENLTKALEEADKLKRKTAESKKPTATIDELITLLRKTKQVDVDKLNTSISSLKEALGMITIDAEANANETIVENYSDQLKTIMAKEKVEVLANLNTLGDSMTQITDLGYKVWNEEPPTPSAPSSSSSSPPSSPSPAPSSSSSPPSTSTPSSTDVDTHIQGMLTDIQLALKQVSDAVPADKKTAKWYTDLMDNLCCDVEKPADSGSNSESTKEKPIIIKRGSTFPGYNDDTLQTMTIDDMPRLLNAINKKIDDSDVKTALTTLLDIPDDGDKDSKLTHVYHILYLLSRDRANTANDDTRTTNIENLSKVFLEFLYKLLSASNANEESIYSAEADYDNSLADSSRGGAKSPKKALRRSRKKVRS